MLRALAWIMLLLGAAYVGWIVILNLPGRGGPPAPPPVGRAASRGLAIPVAGVAADQLVDTFDDARSAGRVHDAIDIVAPRGTPVIAAAAGTVEKLFESERGGHTVYIRRPGGQWIDYYAHLDSYAPGLAEGQRVPRGRIIGTVGSTGDASPEAPHLHYAINAMAPGETWWQGRAVNPYPLLKRGG